MSDTEKTYTLADVRIAFTDGAFFKYNRPHLNNFSAVLEGVNAACAERYPSPKRLRVIETGGVSFRCKDGVLQGALDGGRWLTVSISEAAQPWNVTQERVKIWADLLAHPYEEEK